MNRAKRALSLKAEIPAEVPRTAMVGTGHVSTSLATNSWTVPTVGITTRSPG